LRRIIDRLVRAVTAVQLFPSTVVIHFALELRSCGGCGTRLHVQKTRPKMKVSTLAIGDFIAHETVYCCRRCGEVYHSTELRTLKPEYSTFGYDVIVFIGESLFLRCHNYQQIRHELAMRNVEISESEIAFLAKKFVLYLASLHRSVRRKTKRHMRLNGGYVLHLDGTCDGGSPHLISALDGITEIVLENVKLQTENAADLIPFLTGIKASYGAPLAVVSDMGKGIAGAVNQVFANTPTFICHYHFLKAVGRALLGDERAAIREKLRRHNVRVVLNRAKTRLEQIIDEKPEVVSAMVMGIETHRLPPIDVLGAVPAVVAYTLISWVLDAGSEGNGFGFPFDRAYLALYQRLREVGLRLHELFTIRLRGDWKENKVYSKISHDLHGVLDDATLRELAQRMEEKVAVFDRLRKAMRITLPEHKRGLNDSGERSVRMNTIEREVEKFRTWLTKNNAYSQQQAYQKLVEQIDAYREKLFADPIVVKTQAGTVLVQPQRTNNILERFFRMLMRGYRKKNGFNSVERIFKTMLADTPLTMNLKNREYVQLLLGGNKTLAEKFAEVDAAQIRRRLAQSRNAATRYPQLRRIIRLPDLPKSVVSVLQRAAS
jgi:hypothetical protein